MALEDPEFGIAPRGYDCLEVDTLVDQIEGTLAGTAGAGAVTPDAVRSARFTTVVRGYGVAEVDAYLDEVVVELERRAVEPVEPVAAAGWVVPAGSAAAAEPVVPPEPMVPVEPVEPVAKSKAELRRERTELLRCSELPAGERFKRVTNPFSGGYAVEEVDAFVNRARKLGAKLSGGEVCVAWFPPSKTGYAADVVDDWLGRLGKNLDLAAQAR
jgi:DivIVA domain-containing protein